MQKWVLVRPPDIREEEFEKAQRETKKRLPRDALLSVVFPNGKTIKEAGNDLAGKLEAIAPQVALIPATELGKHQAAWAAARLGGGLTAQLLDFFMDEEGKLHQIRMACGGSWKAEIICPYDGIQMATLHSFLYASDKTRAEGLEGAAIVVAGGLGVGKDGFLRLKRLAALLGARLGATRAAVDAGYAPYSAQIGQSGVFVRPAFYLAFGISGAVQHRAGMKDSGVVVAVNRDPKAEIFQYADYGICGDAVTTINRMIEILEGGKEHDRRLQENI